MWCAMLLLLLIFLSSSTALLQTTSAKSRGKESFYTALNAPQRDAKSIDTTVNQLTASNTINMPKRLTSLGKWNVVWAPHINTLQMLTFTSFDVSYSFSSTVENALVSNVVYSSPIFGSGHLNTEGSIRLNKDNTECYIVWDKIWWDFEQNGPTTSSDTSKHVLPDLIQKVGKAAFVEGVSRFPIQYVDDDTCVFLFTALGTRICARKVTMKGRSGLSESESEEEISIFTPDGNLQLGPYIQAKLGRRNTTILALILTSPYLLFAIRGLRESGLI